MDIDEIEGLEGIQEGASEPSLLFFCKTVFDAASNRSCLSLDCVNCVKYTPGSGIALRSRGSFQSCLLMDIGVRISLLGVELASKHVCVDVLCLV